MILCAKCKKRPDAVTEKMCVLHYRYDLTAKCHGETETKSFTHKELEAGEANGISFFSPDAALPLEKKAKRKVSSGT